MVSHSTHCAGTDTFAGARRVGTYTYPLAGAALPHAATSISGGSISTTFAYDLNGNQTSGLGRSISYTSFNKPSSITQGSRTLFFSHDADHQPFKQTAPEGITRYFDAFGVHAKLFSSAVTQWNDYLMVGGALIGVRVLHSDETVTTRYFHSDNLGSIAVITDENGNVVERDGYDAWGKRRFPTGRTTVRQHDLEPPRLGTTLISPRPTFCRAFTLKPISRSGCCQVRLALMWRC